MQASDNPFLAKEEVCTQTMLTISPQPFLDRMGSQLREWRNGEGCRSTLVPKHIIFCTSFSERSFIRSVETNIDT